MNGKLHARCLDIGRLALIGLAASATIAAADPFASVEGQISQSDSLDLAIMLASQLPAGDMLSLAGTSAAPTEAESTRGALFLMSLYEDGSIVLGTGTVVKSSVGATARVLTAGHVAALEMAETGSELSETLAFDASGKFRAVLGPTVISGTGPTTSELDASKIAADMAVLEVLDLAPDISEAEWTSLGREIAPRQSEGLMIAQPESGSLAANPGLSGASILDAEGRIIGVASYSAHLTTDARGPGGSAYLTQVIAGISPASDLDFLLPTLNLDLQGLQGNDRDGRRRDGILIATPIVHEEIIDALGADVEIVPSQEGVHQGTVTGFPDRELRSTSVGFVEMQAISAVEAAWDRDAFRIEYAVDAELPSI